MFRHFGEMEKAMIEKSKLQEAIKRGSCSIGYTQ